MEKKYIFIIGFSLIGLVILYFAHSYFTIQIVQNELKNLVKEKRRKIKYEEEDEEKEIKINNKKVIENKNIEEKLDIDSYVNIDEDNDNNDANPISEQSSKLSKSNIMLRDMVDGSRQK